MEHAENKLMGYGTLWGRPGGLIHIVRIVYAGGRWYSARPICGGMGGVAYPGQPNVVSTTASEVKLTEHFGRTPCPRCLKRAPRAEVAS